MIAGVGPLEGAETIGSFVDADGAKTTWFFAADGAGWINPGGERAIDLWMPGQKIQFKEPPIVAVLIDRGTASSGEATAVSFQGRPRSRSFGRHTHGQTTANRGFELSDGANIVLTTGLEADRTGKIYSDGISPDVELPEETQVAATAATDPMIQAAAAWIKSVNSPKP